MAIESSPAVWLGVTRASHDRLAAAVSDLAGSELRGGSYCRDWSIAQVLSHLGSQAEIFAKVLDAGLRGVDPPGPDSFPPVWDRWDAKTPEDQVTGSLTANEALLDRLEGLDREELDHLRVRAFGREMGAAGLLQMRLSEHAIHTWDVLVALRPGTRVAPDAVDLLIDGLPSVAARAGTAQEPGRTVEVSTTDPSRSFLLRTGGVEIAEDAAAGPADASLRGPSEVLLRLVYGRLDQAQASAVEITGDGISMEELQRVFPGF